jgi:threonine/homoserine/homoserine lactone efflux protein
MEFSLFATGLMLGLSAGIYPGPLMTLVISETLKHNFKEGLKVAFIPIVTDLPVILLSFFLVSKAAEYNYVFGIISLVGAFFLFYLGYSNISTKPEKNTEIKTSLTPFKKAILTNLLNPNPYLFWITIGAPLIKKGLQSGYIDVGLFFIGFYSLLVGSKVIVAALTIRMRDFLKSKIYKIILRVLGMALILFGLFFLREAYNYLAGYF